MLTEAQIKQLGKQRVGDTGNRLAAAIKLAETTNAAVARSTGFTQQYVSDVACGRYDDIKVGNATLFADFFGCTIELLFPVRQAVAS
jgi:hypothetical protein